MQGMKKLIDKIESASADQDVTDSCSCCSCEYLAEMGEDKSEESKGFFSNPRTLIIIGLALTIPIVLLELFYDSLTADFISLALATPVQIMLGRPFYARFFEAIQQRKGFTTDALVVLSTSVAYGYSVIALMTGQELHFFEASASVLTIFTIGEYLEGRVLQTTSKSLKNLFALKPKTATIIRRRDGKDIEETVDADSIVVDDIVVARPGEKIATDGVIIDGLSSVDESMITGESIPVDKKTGDNVIGGTINKSGYLRLKATSVGSDTVLAHIVQTVEEARKSKAPIQRLADRAVRYFIPIVLAISLASSLYWLVVAQQPVSLAVTVFATVLVVSCPCALGIATPMVVSLGIDRAARHGVLIKGGQYLERLASVDTVVFDKTGTLTRGQPEVTDVISNEGFTEYEVLQVASSAEIKSEHPISRAIVNKAIKQNIPAFQISGFEAVSGHGIIATYLRHKIFIGSPSKIANLLGDSAANPQSMQSKISKLEAEGKTVVAVFVDDRMVGAIAVADVLREEAKKMIDEIKEEGKRVVLLTGDNERTAQAIANKLGIGKILAQILPEEKGREIKKLQDRGRIVAMVGDGINDAPALTQADIGIAMGSGTDVAMTSGHVILVKNNLQGVVFALNMGRHSLKKIKQNLAMSFIYNAVSISIAAGILYGFTNSLILTPALAALGWIVSDSAVFGNSLLITKYHGKKKKNWQ